MHCGCSHEGKEEIADSLRNNKTGSSIKAGKIVALQCWDVLKPLFNAVYFCRQSCEATPTSVLLSACVGDMRFPCFCHPQRGNGFSPMLCVLQAVSVAGCRTTQEDKTTVNTQQALLKHAFFTGTCSVPYLHAFFPVYASQDGY